VQPHYTVLDGQDPIAFILSMNVARRHLTMGQKAMAAAIARSFNDQSVRKVSKM
jgi:hypothetical protein